MAFLRHDRRFVAAAGGIGATAGVVVLVARNALTHPVLLAVLLGTGGAMVTLNRLVERRNRDTDR